MTGLSIVCQSLCRHLSRSVSQLTKHICLHGLYLSIQLPIKLLKPLPDH